MIIVRGDDPMHTHAGFSDNNATATYKVEDELTKLTIEEMNA